MKKNNYHSIVIQGANEGYFVELDRYGSQCMERKHVVTTPEELKKLLAEMADIITKHDGAQ